jgi:peptide/nickel transport system ATP-binding protein
MSETILQTRGLHKRFGGQRRLFAPATPLVHAVNGVDLAVRASETLGIVGESGCGKSTLARMLAGLDRPSEGEVCLHGQPLDTLRKADPNAFRRQVQFVFQDPLSSLNPRKTVRQILATPMRHLLGRDAAQIASRSEELMSLVGLRPEFIDRHPHELSGGQAQRVGIARALAAEAQLMLLDEPVSALDVSVQAQILKLLRELRTRLGLTYMFISHDLAVVENLCDRVAVMYLGHIVETAPRDTLFNTPRHPYTHLLLSSVPVPGERRLCRERPAGELPDPTAPPAGCPFAPRCPWAEDRCRSKLPPLRDMGEAHQVACHLADRLA